MSLLSDECRIVSEEFPEDHSEKQKPSANQMDSANAWQLSLQPGPARMTERKTPGRKLDVFLTIGDDTSRLIRATSSNE